MHRAALICGLFLGTFGLANAAQAGPGVTLGGAAALGGGTFSTGGGISVAVEAHQINGTPYLCGVWARSPRLSAYVTHRVHDVLSSGVVQSGDDILLRDFRAFRQVPAAQTYVGAPANCVAVSRQVNNLTVRIPRRSLATDRGIGAPRHLAFKPSSTANPAYSHGSFQQWLFSQIDSPAE